ncbi:MAG TPA: cupredoxin domain-containing protein [Polyangia bacterium]|nr:cupredoxin domain-containing protein [Polyangia bacterium]
MACALALAPLSVRAAGDAAPGDIARVQGEIDRLKQELADQRQLILQLMQAEQQRYDVVLKYLRAGGGGGDVSALPPPPSPSSVMPKSASSSESSKDTGGGGGHEAATVTGKVKTSGGQIGEAYVYIDGLRSSAKGHTVEIKQRDKQFAPRVVVVPLGTKLVFPNQDTVIHNVFSTASGNSFDLGSVKGGETSPPVVLLKPGPVEIFCNIHSKMRADVLVVPNNHWTRVAADGSFSLSGVPVGNRRIVLWSPTLKPVSQQVDVTAKGGTVTFASEAMSVRPHLNKRGQAYGSYDE